MTPIPHRKYRRGGFSLIEMITAVTVLALVFTVVVYIVGAIRDTVNLGGAQDETLSVAQAVEARMRDDIARLNTDAFMVIRAASVTYTPDGFDSADADIEREHRIDQLAFFANGPWTSTLDSTIQAPTAWVSYGHLRFDNTAIVPEGDSRYDTAPPHLSNRPDAINKFIVPRQWTLGRRTTLLSPTIPISTDTNAPEFHTSSIWRNDNNYATPLPNAQSRLTLIDTATTDLAVGSISSYRQALLQPAATTANIYTFMGMAATRRWGFRDYNMQGAIVAPSDPLSFPLRFQAPLVAASLAPYCSDFRVDYAIDADNDGAVDIQDADLGDGYPAHIIWHRLNPRPGSANEFERGGSIFTSGDMRAFGFDIAHDDTGIGFNENNPNLPDYGRTYDPNDSNVRQIFGEGLEVTGDGASGIYRAWPVLLRITMTLHDAEGYLHQQHEETRELYEETVGQRGSQWVFRGEPDGQKLQLILRVPPKP
ncbi:MAG: prepilin-type N-terminal cleavage/methylation domain-containing protein [Phycisphaeraceae bacterium]